MKNVFDRTSGTVSALLVLLLLGLLLLGPGLPVYLVNVAGQVMCFVLLAMAVDLMWGGAGVLSLGHGLFFAIGGYIAAMHLLRTAYASTHVLPDFLLFMGNGGQFLIGPRGERWDRALLVRQQSLETFMAFAVDEDYLAGIGHRTAAVADTRLLPLTGLSRS